MSEVKRVTERVGELSRDKPLILFNDVKNMDFIKHFKARARKLANLLLYIIVKL